MAETHVNKNSAISGSIIGWKCKIGKWTRLEGLSILGEDVTIGDEVLLNAVTVMPNVVIKNSILKPDSIILC